MFVGSQSIELKYVFGLKCDTHGSVYQLDESRVIYTAGHNIVVYNTEDNQMKFFHGQEYTLGITAITLSPLRRHLAVAERADATAFVIIYDTQTERKKRTLNTPDCQSHEYVSMEFAPGHENKYLITMGGAPDWVLVFWHWERQKVLCFIQVSVEDPVYQVSFNPLDESHGIIATGKDTFRWYKLQENNLEPQSTEIHNKDEDLGSEYLCHCWLRDGRLIVSTEQGELLILDEHCEFLGYIKIALNNFYVTAIIPCECGFIVGGSRGLVLIFDSMSDDRRPDYRQRPRVIVAENESVACVKGLSLTPATESRLVITMNNAQIYSIEFNSNREDAEPLSQPFHSDRITGLDVCTRKPLLVTCSDDKTVRIWNYLDKTLEICEVFNDRPQCVAFHPSGFHIVVGFLDKLRMMNLINNSIRSFKDISVKSCVDVQFSHGGHLFAATNETVIKIFNFYLGESPSHLEIKRQPGKVRALAWSKDDSSFVYAGLDGIFEHKLSGPGQAQEYPQKGVNYSCVLFGPELAVVESTPIYAVGTDKFLKEFIDHNEARKIETKAILGQLALSHSGKLLFAGLSDERPGAIRCYKFSALSEEHSEFAAHAEGVTRMRVSHDDNFLFTTGRDGCLLIWNVKDKDIRALKSEKEALSLSYAEEILSTKSEIEELKQQIESLVNQNRDHAVSSRNQYEEGQQKKKDHIDKLNEQLNNDRQQDQNRYDSLEESTKEVEQHYKERFKADQEKCEIAKQEAETKHQQDFMIEVSRYNDLLAKKEEESRIAEDTIQSILREHQNTFSAKSADFTQKLKEEMKEIERLTQENELQRTKFRKIEEQLERENNDEYRDLQGENEKDLKRIREESQKVKGKVTKVKRRDENTANETERLSDDLKGKKEQIHSQTEELKKLQMQISSKKADIEDKDRVIGEKEKKIYEYKQSNQVLEKFKFVLDYKIKELKQESGPREVEINKMKEDTSKMDTKLKLLSALNETLGSHMKELEDKQEMMQAEIQKQRHQIRDSHTTIKSIKDGVYDCAQNIQDFRKLKESILKLFNKYIKTEGRTQEPDTEKEFARQCEYLQSSIYSLRNQLKEVTDKHQQENQKIMRINAELIEEIYVLRKIRNENSNVRKQYEQEKKKQNPRRSLREEELARNIEKNREEIKRMRERINDIDSARPPSQGRLPPLGPSVWAQD